MVADFTIIREDRTVYMRDEETGQRKARKIPNMEDMCPAYVHAVQWDSSGKIG
ncbi:MAG: hypothetical protein GY788_11865, partial [bacterium]|nr:hypothetical protein [bacterium]